MSRAIPLLLALIMMMMASWTVPSRAGAQPQGPMGAPGAAGMPNLRQISGKPLPDRGMAPGTVTVRLGRKAPSNPVANTEITALVEGPGGDMRKRTARTDAEGRAFFEGLPAGHQFHAEVVVDGERLATETFPVPDVGGVRVMLISGLGATAEDQSPDESGGGGAEESEEQRPFSMGLVSGLAQRDLSLPRGTLEVTALDESGRPLAGKTIELGQVRAGQKVEVTREVTKADGVARFVGIGVGKPNGEVGAAVVMQLGTLRLGTEAFGIPAEGGIKVELRVPARTSNPSVITIGTGGRVILQLRDDALGFIETLPLENTSEKIFDPGPGGVEIRLPTEFINAEAAEGPHKIEIRKGIGVAVHGVIGPRRAPSTDPNHKSPDEVTFGFVLPLTGSSRDFEQRFPNGLGEFTFISDQLAGMTVDSAQITGQQERAVGAKKYWLMRGEPVPPGGTLRFTVRGLPAPDNTGRIVAAVLTLSLIAAAFVFGRSGGSGQKQGEATERERLVQRREKLFTELVTLEDRDVGQRSGRGELVQKLESIYRELAALDERRAV